MRFSSLLGLGASILVLAAGCGGSAGDDLLSGVAADDPNEEVEVGSGGGGTSGAAGGELGADASAEPEADVDASSDGASMSDGAPEEPDADRPSDDAAGGDGAAGGDIDGGAAVGEARIVCGLLPCQAAQQSCCVEVATRIPLPVCVAKGSLCVGVMIACDSPDDCAPGEQCCGNVFGVGCQPSCDVAKGQHIACDPQAKTPTCPNGMTCTDGLTIPFYSFCQ